MDKKLLRVRLTMPLVPSDAPLFLPGGANKWGGCEFVINPPDEDPCDYWIVLGFAFVRETARMARENTLFICGEPPSKKIFPKRFYDQFYRIIDTHRLSGHPRVDMGTPCMGWHVGRHLSEKRGEFSYDHFTRLSRPQKINKIGVVCSSSAKTKGQRNRLRFLERLKDRFGDQIVHFGRGFAPIDDKLDAILPYRYQLVLENSVSPHYWTEKLADAYLGWGFPLYVGCPNLSDYFPSTSFQMLDLNNENECFAIIKKRLQQADSVGEIAAVAEARKRVLNDYNLTMRCAHLAQKFHVKTKAEAMTIYDYKTFQIRNRFFRWLRFSRTGTQKPANQSHGIQ